MVGSIDETLAGLEVKRKRRTYGIADSDMPHDTISTGIGMDGAV